MAACYELNKMIAGQAFADVTRSGVAMSVALKEESSDAKYGFIIRGLPENTVVLKGDAYFSVCLDRPGPVEPNMEEFKGKSFFRHGTHTGKRADYIIIDWENEIIVFLEMKKKKDDPQSIRQQHIGAEAVLDYIRRVGACYFDEKYEAFLGKGFKRHYVVVGYTDMRGRKSGQVVFAGKSTLTDPLKISHASQIYYKKLKGQLS